jgi:hypothetical protein
MPIKTLKYCLRAHVVLATRHLRPAALLNVRPISTGNIVMLERD